LQDDLLSFIIPFRHNTTNFFDEAQLFWLFEKYILYHINMHLFYK